VRAIMLRGLLGSGALTPGDELEQENNWLQPSALLLVTYVYGFFGD
jgi:hypothetical protein